MAYFIQSLCPVLNHFQKENLPTQITSINSNVNKLLSHNYLTKHVNSTQHVKRVTDILSERNVANKLFDGMQIAIHIPSTDEAKVKYSLRKNIIDNGGQVSYTVTRESTLIVSGSSDIASAKLSTANRFCIPIVTANYIDECLKEGKLLGTKNFSLRKKLQSEAFQKGKINSTSPPKSASNLNTKVSTHIEPVPFRCLENYDLIKAVLLCSSKKASHNNKHIQNKVVTFMVIELHTLKNEYLGDTSSRYCVFTHEGTADILDSKSEDAFEKKLCRFTDSVDQARSTYCNIFYHTSGPPSFFKVTEECPSQSIGTPAFQESCKEFWATVNVLDTDIKVLVSNIWNETKLHISQFINNFDNPLPEWKVKEAEGLLIQIAVSLSKNKLGLVNKLSKEFYSAIAFKSEHSTPLTNASDILSKFELCKILMNMAQIYEFSKFSANDNIVAKYKALKCKILPIDPKTEEFQQVSNRILSSQSSDTGMIIHKVYSVKRNLESNTLDADTSNFKYLFHGSTPSNILGILIQGLTPSLSTLLHFYGLENTEECMLGYGIYFSDSVNACLRFAKPSSTGTSFMLVCKVGLGKIFKTYEPLSSLVSAPNGYESVLGVKSQEGQKTCFQENEYVIYKENQTELCYLVEFYLPNQTVNLTPIINDSQLEEMETSNMLTKPRSLPKYSLEESIPDVKEDIVNSGLKEIRNSETETVNQVPLESTHIRTYIVDLIARVTVFQVYRSGAKATKELQYTFPLSGGAAVCGFEAFIGNKHMIGQVKEKTIAHTEFKEAVSQGHGAYLLDEEKPDVFTARIGNLPANTKAIIKITYITELSVDSDTLKICFSSSLSPSQLQKNDASLLVSPTVTFEAGLEMATNILTILSPTHAINVKNTDTKAVVNLREFNHWKNGLILSIRMSDIHIPRMWIEEHPENKTEVCMVSYYPEFVASSSGKNTEVILLIDASSSMSGPAFQSSLSVALLCLKNFTRSISFNIIAFGATFKELFPESQQFTAKSMSQAIEFLRNVFPEMGGSNILSPLRSCNIFTKFDKTNVFLISDGFFESENMLCSKISKLQYVRLFTFAVGTNPNKHFLKLASNCSGGAYEEFFESEKNKWCCKVQDQVFKASQPSLHDVNIEWQQFDKNGEAALVVAPQKIKSLFSGSFLVAYGFVSNCTVATLKAKINEQEYTTVVSSHKLNQTSGTLIHSLAARAFIRDWEDGVLEDRDILHVAQKENRKDDITKMAVDYSLVTSLTSFIAVEKRQDGEEITEEPSLDMLLLDCVVDILPYMSFEEPLSISVENLEPTVLACDSLDSQIPEDYLYERKRLHNPKTRRKKGRGVCPNYEDFPPLPSSNEEAKPYGIALGDPSIIPKIHTRSSLLVSSPKSRKKQRWNALHVPDNASYKLDKSITTPADKLIPVFNTIGMSLQSDLSLKEKVDFSQEKLKTACLISKADTPWQPEAEILRAMPLLSSDHTIKHSPVRKRMPKLLSEEIIPFSSSSIMPGGLTFDSVISIPENVSEVLPPSSGATPLVLSAPQNQNISFDYSASKRATPVQGLFGSPAKKVGFPLFGSSGAKPIDLGSSFFMQPLENAQSTTSNFAPSGQVGPVFGGGIITQDLGRINQCSSSKASCILTNALDFGGSSDLKVQEKYQRSIRCSYVPTPPPPPPPPVPPPPFKSSWCNADFQPATLQFSGDAVDSDPNKTFKILNKTELFSANAAMNYSLPEQKQKADSIMQDFEIDCLDKGEFGKGCNPFITSRSNFIEPRFSDKLSLAGVDGSLASYFEDLEQPMYEELSSDVSLQFRSDSNTRIPTRKDDVPKGISYKSGQLLPIFFVSVLRDRERISLDKDIISFLENALGNRGGGFPLCGMIYKSIYKLFPQLQAIIQKYLDVPVQSYIDYYWEIIFEESALESKNVYVQQGVQCISTLKKSGLKSMGPVIKENILQLIKMASFVFAYFVSFFPLLKQEMESEITDITLCEKFVDLIEALADEIDDDIEDDTEHLGKILESVCTLYCLKRMIEIDQKYPLMYSILGLGSSWEETIFKQLYKVSN